VGQRALLLVNRYARRGETDLSEAIAALQAAGLEVIQEAVETSWDLADTIRQYCDQVDCVVVAGGDGTLNWAINGLLDTQLPLGVLPLGTANDLARTLGIPLRLPEACAVIAQGKHERIDLGWVNDRYFFNTGSLGLTVQISRQLPRELKHRWGVLAYGMTGFQILRESQPFWAELRIDGGEVKRMRSVLIVVANGRYWGGRLTIAQNASIADQKLHVCSLNIEHWWQIVPVLPSLWAGNYPKDADWIDAFECQEVEIRTLSSLDINTDGESTTQTPAQFRVVPRALSVFVP
jgi:diacylglycerol kinase (ATP)